MRLTQRNNLVILTAVLLNRRALAISELARAAAAELPASHRQRKSVSGVSFPTTTLPPYLPNAP